MQRTIDDGASAAMAAPAVSRVVSPVVSRVVSPVVSRVGAALVGGYAFVWGFTVLAIALQVAAGVGYGDARTLAYLLAFVVFLGAFLWSFGAASAARVWLVLAGGGAAMTGAGWLLARSLA